MKLYVYSEDGSYINSVTEYDDGAGGYVEVEVDDGFDVMTISDYRLNDGTIVYTGEGTAAREEAEKQAQAEAERKQAIDEGCQAFFIDGGKSQMKQAIEDAAASSGTDPQLQAIARMQVMAMDLSPVASSTIAEFRDYWPDWEPKHEYKKNDPIKWKGQYYRVSQPHTSSYVYPPDTAGESMYYPVTIADDGIIVYRECHGDYDMVTAGETRHYPDADGPVYRAKVDTAYDPSTVPDNWELVDDADSE